MKPQFTAYTVRESKGKKYWTKLGVAFPIKTGGFNLSLEAMPAAVDGQYKIVVLPPKEEDADVVDDAE